MHMKRRRNINFSLDRDERNTFKEKCRIINEVLFGKNRFDWLSPDGLVRQLKSYEKVLKDKEARFNCKHLLDVLGYFQRKEISDSVVCPPSLAVYDYALELADYLGLRREGAMAASAGFSIRELKKRLWNFADDERKSDEDLLQEKCRIINQNLFGEDENEWKNPKELAKFLTYSFPKVEDNREAADHCIQLINVITYYVARVEGRSAKRPDSVEVYESSEKLASALNPKPEPEPEPEPPKEEPKKEYDEEATKELDRLFGWFSKTKSADKVKSALDNGANPNELDSYKQSFLLKEVFRKCKSKKDKQDRLETIKVLLENGADPNILRRDDSCSPLYVAAERNDIDVVKLLVEHGADTDVKTDRGRTPVVVALERGYNEVADYLSNKGADIDVKSSRGSPTLALTIKSCNTDGAKALVEMGADVNAKDNIGCSPLMWAVANGDLDTVKYFVEKGADVNSAEKDGYTPLMWAILSDDTETAKFLLDKGANPNLKPKDTLTPLMRAVENDNAQIVKALLKHGAKPDETVEVLEHRTCHRNSGWHYPDYIKRTAMDYVQSQQVKDLLEGKDIADKDLKQGEKFNTLKAVLKKSKETGKPVHTICNAIAKKTLVPRVWQLAKEHNIPIRKVVVQPKAQRTKLGHCVSNTGEISMNVATTLFPQEIRDHIILHELSHIDNPHHRESFWEQCNKLDKFTPEHDQEIDTWSRRVMRFFPR